MMSTFLLLFAFVINTGMLVNAKINLQNAADLAAYAGASVQARQLTQIGYLNYEMRRQYKKFLFRIYVLGNMAQEGFPSTVGASQSKTPMTYVADLSTNTDYRIPVTCVIFNASDNYCHIENLPEIRIPPVNPLDSVTEILAGQLQAIELIRQNNCYALGHTNLMLNMLWLYNADPDLKNFSSTDTLQTNTAKTLQALATGLGIIPRLMILKWRINTLASYVNAGAQRNLTLEQVSSLASSPDPSQYERSIQAFYSAYYTLGNHAFPGGSISMEELLPGDGNGSALLKLNDIKDRFDTYAIDFDTSGSGTGSGLGAGANLGALQGQNRGSACNSYAIPVSIPKPIAFGVYKDPSILTYYAIKLTATARVLFSPFGDIQMTAYAAAQPFGSRIGPTDKLVQFVGNIGAAPKRPANTALSNASDKLPNLAVREADSAARGNGWDTKEVVGSLFQSLGLAASTNAAITSGMIEKSYRIAMAPSPWESTRYTIMYDGSADAMMKNFDGLGIGAFWAPIFPPGSTGKSADLKAQIAEFFNVEVQGSTGAGNQSNNIQNIVSALTSSLGQYINATLNRPGGGEDGESTNIVRITNPFTQSDGRTEIPRNPLRLMDSAQIKTAWNSVNREDYLAMGRVGYSVKFVSFDSLLKRSNSTNGQDVWTNLFEPGPANEADLKLIKH